MGRNVPRSARLDVFIFLVLAVATACDSTRPSPPASPTGPDGNAAPPKVVGDLERPPLARSLAMLGLGTVAAIWAVASLVAG